MPETTMIKTNGRRDGALLKKKRAAAEDYDAPVSEAGEPVDEAGSEARAEIARLLAEHEKIRERIEALRKEAFPEERPLRRGDGSATPGASSLPPAPARTRGRTLGRRILGTAGLLALAGALAVGGAKSWSYLQSFESTDDAQVDGHINAISSRIDGTIAKVYVENTHSVKAGQVLAEIDPRDYQVALAQARANYAQALAQVESARRDYQAAVARVRQSEATNVKAQRDAARYQELFETRVASREQYEEQVRVANVDAAQVVSNRASAASAEKTIASREAAVAAAKAALDQAELNLSYTKIVAPVSGVVGKKTVEAGQRVQAGEQLLAITPLDDTWVTANFKETQLRRIQIGNPVTIHVDALGRDFRGHVVGLAGASGQLYSLLPPENATGNYVKVVQRFPLRIAFDPGQDPDHRLRPGMSVEPTVWLQ